MNSIHADSGWMEFVANFFGIHFRELWNFSVFQVFFEAFSRFFRGFSEFLGVFGNSRRFRNFSEFFEVFFRSRQNVSLLNRTTILVKQYLFSCRFSAYLRLIWIEAWKVQWKRDNIKTIIVSQSVFYSRITFNWRALFSRLAANELI